MRFVGISGVVVGGALSGSELGVMTCDRGQLALGHPLPSFLIDLFLSLSPPPRQSLSLDIQITSFFFWIPFLVVLESIFNP